MTHLRMSDDVFWASDDDSDDDIVFMGANRSHNYNTQTVVKQEFDADSLIEDSEDHQDSGGDEEEEQEEDSSMLDDDSDLDDGMDILILGQDGEQMAMREEGDDGEVLKMLLARADSRRSTELRIEVQGVEATCASNGIASMGTEEKVMTAVEIGSIRR